MNINLAIATYRKKDYEEIRRLSEDRDQMDLTWEEWTDSKKKSEAKFKTLGFATSEVIITPQELVQFCREERRPVNGEARLALAQAKANGAWPA